MAENQSTHLQGTHALYRFYDDLGQLLYVGITHDPAKRMGQHAATKAWWTAVRGISLEWYPSRIEALAAERRAIKVERPLTNIVRPAPYAPPSPPCGHCMSCRDRSGPCTIEDEIGSTCYHCGKDDCLYSLGYDDGSQDGWSLAAIRHRHGGAL